MITRKSVLNTDKINTYEEMLAIDVSDSSLKEGYLKQHVNNKYSFSDLKSGKAVLVSDNPQLTLYRWSSIDERIEVNPSVYSDSELVSTILSKLNHLIPKANGHAKNVSRGGFVSLNYVAYAKNKAMDFSEGWIEQSASIKEINSAGNRYNDLDLIQHHNFNPRLPLKADVKSAMSKLPEEWRSPQLEKYLSNSKKLTSGINEFIKNNGEFEKGHTNSGAYIKDKVVKISPEYANNPDSLLTNLAHEVGHGLQGHVKTKSPFLFQKKSDYVDAVIKSSQIMEGEAQLFAMDVSNEIAANSGVRIPINARQSKMKQYRSVYREYLNTQDRASAQLKMGELIGKYETPSRPPGRKYYSTYQQKWSARAEYIYDIAKAM